MLESSTILQRVARFRSSPNFNDVKLQWPNNDDNDDNDDDDSHETEVFTSLIMSLEKEIAVSAMVAAILAPRESPQGGGNNFADQHIDRGVEPSVHDCHRLPADRYHVILFPGRHLRVVT